MNGPKLVWIQETYGFRVPHWPTTREELVALCNDGLALAAALEENEWMDIGSPPEGAAYRWRVNKVTGEAQWMDPDTREWTARAWSSNPDTVKWVIAQTVKTMSELS